MKISDFLSFLNAIVINKSLLLCFLFISFIFLNLSGQNYYEKISLKKTIPIVLGEKIVLPEASKIPKNVAGLAIPLISAKSIIVIDASGVILYERNSSSKLYPASTTKIMTALVALEAYPLEKRLLVSQKYNDGQKIGLSIGEEVTAENLLKALLIASANDAAEVLAANYPGGRNAFIARMNEKAKELQLKNTNFVNPTGIDENGQWTTAVDLARLSKFAMKNPVFSKLVATKRETIKSSNVEKTYSFDNINQLLGRLDGIKGVKTGYTNLAGECLVSAIERNGELLYMVVLASSDRFGETTKLANWTFANFAWF